MVGVTREEGAAAGRREEKFSVPTTLILGAERGRALAEAARSVLNAERLDRRGAIVLARVIQAADLGAIGLPGDLLSEAKDALARELTGVGWAEAEAKLGEILTKAGWPHGPLQVVDTLEPSIAVPFEIPGEQLDGEPSIGRAAFEWGWFGVRLERALPDTLGERYAATMYKTEKARTAPIQLILKRISMLSSYVTGRLSVLDAAREAERLGCRIDMDHSYESGERVGLRFVVHAKGLTRTPLPVALEAGLGEDALRVSLGILPLELPIDARNWIARIMPPPLSSCRDLPWDETVEGLSLIVRAFSRGEPINRRSSIHASDVLSLLVQRMGPRGWLAYRGLERLGVVRITEKYTGRVHRRAYREHCRISVPENSAARLATSLLERGLATPEELAWAISADLFPKSVVNSLPPDVARVVKARVVADSLASRAGAEAG